MSLAPSHSPTPSVGDEEELGLFNGDSSPRSEQLFQFDSPDRIERATSSGTSHDGSSLLNVFLVPPPPAPPLALPAMAFPYVAPSDIPATASTPPSTSNSLLAQAAASEDLQEIVAESSSSSVFAPSQITEEGDRTILASEHSHEALDDALGTHLIHANSAGINENQFLARTEEMSSIVLDGESVAGADEEGSKDKLPGHPSTQTHSPENLLATANQASEEGSSPVVSAEPVETNAALETAATYDVESKPSSKRKAAAGSGPRLASLPSMAAGPGTRFSGLYKSRPNRNGPLEGRSAPPAEPDDDHEEDQSSTRKRAKTEDEA